MGRVKRIAWWLLKYVLIGLLYVLSVVIRAIIYINELPERIKYGKNIGSGHDYPGSRY